MSARKRAYRLAYDGRPFRGFQRQPDVGTVEGALFAGLEALDLADGVPAGYSAAGRTDAGVSALAQTVAFEAPEWATPRAINAELPGSIRAWARADVEAPFDAMREATHRVYVYYLYAPGADLDRATSAAERLGGEHDFHNLTPDDRGTVRRLDLAVDPEGDYLVVTAGANGFPRQLVRRLVSLVGSVATGGAGLDRIDRVLGPDPVDGPEGVAPAPASPLLLSRVEYPVEFVPDAEAAADARERFAARRTDLRTRARVAGAVVDGLADGDAR